MTKKAACLLSRVIGYPPPATTNTLHHFPYEYYSGAVETAEKLKPRPPEGNCRLGVQYFMARYYGLFFGPKQIMPPEAYRETGRFVEQNEMLRGDVIYAESLFDRKRKPIDTSRSRYETEDLWLIKLHSAVFLDASDQELLSRLPDEPYPEGVPLVWHANGFNMRTAIWTLEQFRERYRIVAVKRILQSPQP